MQHRKETDLKDTDRTKEKLTGGDIVIRNRFFTWLDNFWYHYKWHVIVVAFFAMVSAICFVQCGTKNKADAIVAFAGSSALSGAEYEPILDVFESLVPTEEGEKKVLAWHGFSIYDEETLKQLYTDPDTNKLSQVAYGNAKQVNTNNLRDFSTYVLTGDSAVWLVSEYVYQYQELDQRVVPLADTFGSDLPEGAYDAYAIRLSQTALYKYYDVLKVLPEDTLLVFPKPLVIGSSSDAETYAKYEALYRAIVEFEAP